MEERIRHFWQLVWVLAKTDFKLRYQGSFLGFLWALLKPLFLFGILLLVFSHLFSGSVEHYALQLLTGIIFWNFFSEATQLGLASLLSKSHLLTRIAFPRSAVIIASTLQSLMTFVINVLILLGALLAFGLSLSIWQLFFFASYLIVLYFLVLGFSFLTAPLFLRFRDVNQIWEVLLMGGFYAAPIIYPLTVMPPWLQPWLFINPMTFLIEHAKEVLFFSTFSRIDHHLIYGFLVLALLLFGLWFFKRFEKRVVELL